MVWRVAAAAAVLLLFLPAAVVGQGPGQEEGRALEDPAAVFLALLASRRSAQKGQ